MKTILLISICDINSIRIYNQLDCLKKYETYLKLHNIQPVFTTADKDIKIDGYDVIYLENLEEKYTNLCRKIIYSLEYINNNYNFDSVIKIDDDTLFNVNRLDPTILRYDYAGRFFDSFSKNEIVINLPAYNMKEKIKLYPSAYDDTPFSFASGDFYVLSKKSIQRLISNKKLMEDFYKENVRISEDQFVGYCLRSDDISKFDYNYETKITIENVLQITANITSLHPINNLLFPHLLNKSPEEQLSILEKSSSLIYRKMLLKDFSEKLKSVIYDFVNSKKNSGMG